MRTNSFRLLWGSIALVARTRGFLPRCGRCSIATTMASSATDVVSGATFGKFSIPESSIFYRSEAGSTAFVNLRPIVPGHVLVIPKRVSPLLADLTDDEYTDLWLAVRKVQGVLKQHYNATAFNVAVQDGKDSGQSVFHVHVHILPRLGTSEDQFHGDRNDDIYTELDEWAPRDSMKGEISRMEMPGVRVDRTPEAMAEEAATYKDLFRKSV